MSIIQPNKAGGEWKLLTTTLGTNEILITKEANSNTYSMTVSNDIQIFMGYKPKESTSASNMGYAEYMPVFDMLELKAGTYTYKSGNSSTSTTSTMPMVIKYTSNMIKTSTSTGAGIYGGAVGLMVTRADSYNGTIKFYRIVNSSTSEVTPTQITNDSDSMDLTATESFIIKVYTKS